MFPRPSRFLRLVVFVTLVIFVVSMYFLNLSISRGNMRLGLELDRSLSRLLVVQERKNAEEKSHESLLDFQQELVAATDADNDPYRFTNESLALDDEFEIYVRRKLERARSQGLRGTVAPTKGDSDQPASIVNPHNFKYIHNPSRACLPDSPSILVYIHSSPVNLKKRQAVRQTWGHPKIMSLFNATMVFILGSVADSVTQRLVNMEAEQYSDIVQEDFLDSYRNLTHKGVAGLKWVNTFCPKAEFILKTDDDVLLDIVSLIDHLLTKVLPSHGRTKLVLCNLWTRMKVMRDPKSKWYIAKEEFEDDFFPHYCSGSAFLLSGDLVRPMYETALKTPFFWVDDYYITGALLNRLGVVHTRLNPAYLLNYVVAEQKLNEDDRNEILVLHVKKLSLFLKLWPKILKRHKGMEKYVRMMNVPRFGSLSGTPSVKFGNVTTGVGQSHRLAGVTSGRMGRGINGSTQLLTIR